MKTKFLLVLSILIMLCGCEKKEDENYNKQQQEEKIEDQQAVITQDYDKPFTITTMDNKTINIKRTNSKFSIDDNKKATLFLFFETWYPSCKVQIEILNDLKEKIQKNANIIGISLDDNKDPKTVKEFLKENNVNFKVSIDANNSFLANAIGEVENIPYMVLIDKNGNIAARYLGVIPEEMLNNEIERILP